MRDLLVEFVDEQTPDEAPPFEYVEQAARERRRRRYVVSAAVAAIVIVVGAVASVVHPSAAPAPSGPTPTVTTPTANVLDDGPPPQQFKVGATVLLLRGEIAVTSVTPDPASRSVLVVNVARDEIAVEPCVPNTVVRILSQDAASIRIAAYRYGVAPDQDEGHQCARQSAAPTTLRLDLRTPLAGRTVYAGSTATKALLN